MPKSKRNKLVTLSKTKRKTREWRGGLIGTVRKLLEEYQNMRNDKLKELREEIQETSKFCMASNKVLKVALGKSETDEQQEGVHRLSERVHGNVGLFFTQLPRGEVEQLFGTFQAVDFARPGCRATEDFVLEEGPLEGPLGPIPHTMEPALRKQGVPSKLNRGVVEVVSEYTVCRMGDRLTPQQTAVLRMFDVKMAVFKMKLLGVWSKEAGDYEALASDDEGDELDEGVAGDMAPEHEDDDEDAEPNDSKRPRR